MSEKLDMTLIRSKDEDVERSPYLSLIRGTYNPYQDTGNQSYQENGVLSPPSEQTEELSKLRSDDLSPVYDDTAQPSRETNPGNIGRSLPTPPPQVSKPTLGVQFPSFTSFKKQKNMKKPFETQAPRQASVRPLRFYDKTSSCGCSSSSSCCCCRPRNCILVIFVLLLAAGCFAGCYYVFVYVIKPCNIQSNKTAVAELNSLLYGEIEFLEQNNSFLVSNGCDSGLVRRMNEAFNDTILSHYLKTATILGIRGSVCRFSISLELDEKKLHGIEKFAAMILEEAVISTKSEQKTKLRCIVIALKTNATSNRCPETSINVTSSTWTRSAVTSSNLTRSVMTTSPAESTAATSRTVTKSPGVGSSTVKSLMITSSTVKSLMNTSSAVTSARVNTTSV